MAKKTYTVKSGTYTGTDNADIFITAKDAGKFTIDAKGGSDTVTVSSGKSGSKINTGKGNDSVKVTGGRVSVIALGASKDTVNITGGTVNRINAQGGDDTITVSGGNGGNINVGGGNDSVKVTGGRVSVITLGAGTNTVNIIGGTVDRINIDKVYKMSNVINVEKQKKIDIGLPGNNNITVAGIHSERLGKTSLTTIQTGNGVDTIEINKGGLASVKTGGSRDKVRINGGSNYVFTGKGNDTIVVNSKYGNYIRADEGKDKITLGKNTKYCVVDGGKGDDTITVKSQANGKIGTLVKGGGGLDTYNIHYKGQTIVLDPTEGSAYVKDTLNIYADSTSLGSLKYFKKNDVLEINGNAHIIGFKTLDVITIKIPEFDFKIVYTPNEIIADSVVYDKIFDIGGLLEPYNAISNRLKSSPTSWSLNSTMAKSLGYKGI